MKTFVLFLAVLLALGACKRPSYGLKSVNYKRTQQYIKRVHGYKPYAKKDGFFKRLGEKPD